MSKCWSLHEEGGLIRVGGVGQNRAIGESKLDLPCFPKSRIPSRVSSPRLEPWKCQPPSVHAVVSSAAVVVEVAMAKAWNLFSPLYSPNLNELTLTPATPIELLLCGLVCSAAVSSSGMYAPGGTWVPGLRPVVF